jgi:hypothetical protein
MLDLSFKFCKFGLKVPNIVVLSLNNIELSFKVSIFGFKVCDIILLSLNNSLLPRALRTYLLDHIVFSFDFFLDGLITRLHLSDFLLQTCYFS